MKQKVLNYISRTGIFSFFFSKGKKEGGVAKIAAFITLPGHVHSLRSTQRWLNDSCQKKEGGWWGTMGSLTMHQTHPRLKAN